jgi:hypothetical protein
MQEINVCLSVLKRRELVAFHKTSLMKLIEIAACVVHRQSKKWGLHDGYTNIG